MSHDRTNEDYEARAASDAASGFGHPPIPRHLNHHPLSPPHTIVHPPGPTSNEVLQLQQRLKERTEQSMLTARRDAERIRALEERNRELRRMVDELRTKP